MQFPVEVKIEPSKSGKTFGVALVKGDKVLLAVKGCKMANGQNGPFVSGPSAKMEDGTWFSYLFMDRAFGDYVTKLALEHMPQAPQPPQRNAQGAMRSNDLESDVPFAKRKDY